MFRTLYEPDEDGIAGPFVVGGVIVIADMITRPCVVVQGTGMGIAFGAQLQLGIGKPVEKCPER